MQQTSRAKIIEQLVFAGLLGVLIVLPLPFGGDRPWAWSLLAIVIGGMLAVWGVFAGLSRSNQAASLRPIFPSLVLYGLVLLWAGLQSTTLAPQSWHNELWGMAEKALGAHLTSNISVNPHESRTGLMRLFTYGGVFLLTFQLCTAPARAEKLVRWVLGASLVYAIYGIVVETSGVDRVLWFPKSQGHIGQLSATFLDRNSFAAYAGLGLVAAMSLLFRPAMRKGDMESGWRFATRALAEYMFARTWLIMLAATILFIAILMTHSRAGLAVAILGVSTYLGFIALTRNSRRFVLAGGGAIMVLASLIFVIAGNGTITRLTNPTSGAEVRNVIYHGTTDAIATAPLVGSGANTFADVFPMYRDETVPVTITRAHNMYLEEAMELGIPAAVMLVLAILWIVLICSASLRYFGRLAHLPCMGIAATALVGTHALVDYNLNIPAVTVTYTALLAVACAQALRLARPEPLSMERRAF